MPHLPLILLLSACNKGAPLTDDSTDSIGLIRDTDLVGLDSGDDSSDDSADSGDSVDSVDSHDTGEISPYTALTLSPAEIVVSPGATWQARAVLTDSEGRRRDASPSWSSSDESVVTVSADGALLALAPGEATLSAETEGLSARASVIVQAGGGMRVRVVDGLTGLPIPDARVHYGSARSTVDADGYATLTVPDGEAVDLTLFVPSSDYIPATVYSVVPRELTLPLRPGSEEQDPSAPLSGDVALDAVPGAEFGEVVVGLVGPSMQRSPLYMDGDDLLADDRTVKWYGVDLSVPGNLFVADQVETWEAVAHEGSVALWSLAGAVPVDEISAGLSSPGDAFGILVSHLDGFRYEVLPDLYANTSIPLSLTVTPAMALDESVLVDLPELPDGFGVDDEVLVLVLEQGDEEGYTLAGFGLGLDTLTASRAPSAAWADSQGAYALAWAEAGGAGSNGPRTLTLNPISEGAVSAEVFLGLPSVGGVFGADRSFTVSTDSSATLVRAYVSSQDGGERDLVFPAGEFSGVIHSNGPSLSLGKTQWSLVTVDTWDQSYEALLNSASLAPRTLEELTHRVSALDEQIIGN